MMDVLKIQENTQSKNTLIKIQLKKANNAKYRKTKSVTFYNTQPVNEVGLFYNTPEPTRLMLNTCQQRQYTLITV